MRRGWMLFILLGVGCTLTVAQEKPEPPKRDASVRADSLNQKGDLPKIELPEFLITGNEAIRLPEFTKTAIDEERVFDASSLTLDPGLREAQPMQLGGTGRGPGSLAVMRDDFSGKVLAGYGSFATPYFDGWFGRTFGSSDVLLKAGYKSSAGHVANAGYRTGYSSLSGGFYLPDEAGGLAGSRVHGNIGLQGDSYNLYGSLAPERERTVTRFMADAAISSDVEDPWTFTSGFHVRTATMKDSLRTAETVVGFEVAVERDIRDVELKGELGLWRDFYSASSAAWDPYFVQTGLSARYQIAEQLDVLGGFRFHLIRGSDTRSVGRLYPRMAVSWYATRWLTAFAKFEPYVQRNSLSSLVESSPYVAPDARILHPEYFTNFSIGAEADASTSVRTKLTLNYRQARNYPVFVDPSTIRVWSPEYGGTVRIVSVDADLYADITDRDNVGASVSVRSTRYSTTDKSIPYFPALLISGLFQHRFPFGLMLGTTMQVIGSQYADTQEQRSLAAFALWDINTEYVIAPRWNVKGTLQNLLDQNQMWWEGYAGPPRTVSLGMSYTW